MQVVQMIADIALSIAAAGAATFVLVYAIGSAWRTTAVGRAIMRFFALIAVIMLLAVLFMFWEVSECVTDWLALIFYTALAVEMWRLVYVLLRTQRRDRRVKERGESR